MSTLKNARMIDRPRILIYAEVRTLNPDIRQDCMQPLFKLSLNVVEYL